MISWVGFKQVAFLYDRSPRFAGETKYKLRKMLRFALDAVTSFSVRPLRLAFYAGGILCVVSLLLLAYSIGAYIVDETIRGWTSIMAVMLFFLAAQFLVLGLIGEYVGRLYLDGHLPSAVLASPRGNQQLASANGQCDSCPDQGALYRRYASQASVQSRGESQFPSQVVLSGLAAAPTGKP